jgi:hypothetical protein
MSSGKRKVGTSADLEMAVLDLQGLPVDPRSASDRGEVRRASADDLGAGGKGVSRIGLRLR